MGNRPLLPDLAPRCIALRVEKLTDRLDRPIVLVGLMGAGKSTVGRRLARRLGLPFVDSDAAIEDAAGYSAAEVFERYGEEDFRDGERRLVARLVDGEVRVIATGGGAFVDPRTRELLNERAITVWLDAPVDVLADRTAAATRARCSERRPARERSSGSRRTRGPSYAEAHIHVTSGDGAHGDVVESIVAALEIASRPNAKLPRPGSFTGSSGKRPVGAEAAVESGVKVAGHRSAPPAARRSRSRYSRSTRSTSRRGNAQLASAPRGPSPPRFRTARAGTRRDRARRTRSPEGGRRARAMIAACGKGLEHRLQLVARQLLGFWQKKMPSAVSAPAVRSRSTRVPSP